MKFSGGRFSLNKLIIVVALQTKSDQLKLSVFYFECNERVKQELNYLNFNYF